MAAFKISKATQKDKAWKAVGSNPVTGKQITLQGGQANIPVGDDNPKS